MEEKYATLKEAVRKSKSLFKSASKRRGKHMRIYKGRKMLRLNKKFGFLILVGLGLCASLAYANKTSGLYPIVKYREMPAPIQELFSKNEPDLGDVGSCATAFDSLSDDDKMVFTCSLYIKILAEGERRGIKRCEEMKQVKGIKTACRIISK